jgi:Ser/Thr protein kinase RdoA (MazF antagonist)
MDLNAQVQRVISQYDLPPVQRIDFIGSAGGFSGAQLWRLTASEGAFCIRRWPKSHPGLERLHWIHRVLVHAHQNGCPFVAAPVVDRVGETIVCVDDALWEISPWMPGKADFLHNSNDRRVGNMTRALASFHLASAQVNLDFNRSTCVSTRVEQLANVDQTISNVQRAPAGSGDQTIENFRQTVSARVGPLARALQSKLSRFTDTVFPVQPVIRDVWHDHVFFTGDQVTGLVDFGAMQIDNVALDLARLLGSTVRDDRNQWRFAVQTYREIRPLSDSEIELLPLLDESGIILGSLNWLKWILLDGRQFENWQGVKKSVDFLAERLQGLAV